MKFLVLAGAAMIVAAPIAAIAQPAQPGTHAADPYQPDNDGSAAASAAVPPGQIAPGVDPGTMSANAGVAGDLAATRQVNTNRQAQYAADLATYDSAMRSHDRASTRYARQKRAYADAMAAWRTQVEACRRGKSVACNAPTPDPANFY